jgi:hypothetical protein
MREVTSLGIVLILWVATGFGAASEGDKGESKDSASPAIEAAPYPSAPVLFDQLATMKNPRWRTLYRPPLGYTFPERTRSAFWLGVNLSELYLAAQARDAQRVINLCRDLESFGRSLGVTKPLKEGVVRLNAHAGKEEWAAAKKEIATTTDRVMTALHAQNDGNLATLVRVGEWVRYVEIAASVVDAESFENLCLAAGGSELFVRLHDDLGKVEIPEKGNERVAKLKSSIAANAKRWCEESGKAPTMEEVTLTKKDMADLLKLFSERQ